MTNIAHLPYEILVRIFSFYLETETQRQFQECLPKVCLSWKKACEDGNLWRTFDGTPGFKVFVRLCKNKILQRTQYVKFSWTNKNVKDSHLQTIFQGIPNVKRLNFSNVENLHERYFTTLELYCPSVCELIINEEKSKVKVKTNFKSIKNYLAVQGSHLLVIDLSYSYIANLKKFNFIAETCPNLNELLALNITTCSAAAFHIEVMQQGCPKLKVLCLGYPTQYSNIKGLKSCSGFPDLEIFSHSTTAQTNEMFSDNHLMKLLFQSNNLKVLDIRGSSLITVDAVCSLPAVNLERLFLSGSRISHRKYMIEIVGKWSHSLKELDIAKSNIESIGDMFCSIISLGHLLQLERLNVSGTKISISAVKAIIENCSKLNFLQLESCRRIGRGHKRAYYQRQNIKALLEKLEDEMEIVE